MLVQLMQIECQILFIETLLAEMIKLIFMGKITSNHLLDLWLNKRLAFVLVPICDLVVMH